MERCTPRGRGRAEATAAVAESAAPELPFLRACLLESVRLWPTTPMILRQTTRETSWNGQSMPVGTGILIFAPFFHRDPTRLPFADRFVPDVWLGRVESAVNIGPALVPFSAGPAICPGRQVALLLSSLMLAEILRGPRLRLTPFNRLRSDAPLPPTFSPYDTTFSILS